jgi:hypothetical protein
MLKYHLIGVVFTYNFNFGKEVLINLELSIGAFLLTALYLIYLVITFTFHLFTALAEYSTLLFSPATQTCYSEGEDGL